MTPVDNHWLDPAQTQWLSGTGERQQTEAALHRAVNTLPGIMAEDMPAALPPAGGDPMAVLARVRELAEGLNSRKWKTARAELLALPGKHKIGA